MMPIMNKSPCCTWVSDLAGMPVVELASLPLDSGPGLPADPWHPLGNSGLTAFIHASGGIQLLSGERGWARLNAGPAGWDWQVVLDGQTLVHPTQGRNPATIRFGCGHAEHHWRLDGHLRVERILSTPPSSTPEDRCSGLLITVRISNRGSTDRLVSYRETLAARYQAANWSNPPAGRIHAAYPAEIRVVDSAATAHFRPQELRPLTFADPDDPAQADGHPPALHLEAPGSLVAAKGDDITASWQVRLQAGSTIELRLAVGYSLSDLPWHVTAARLFTAGDARHAAAWSARLGTVADSEMRWHLHQLLAMATWDQRHRAVYIPQGTLYEYALGVAACARDHIQHALPLARLEPAWCRSTLTYLARRTDAYGHLRHTEEGAGLIPQGSDQKSDSELYALWLVAEYVHHGGDLDWEVDGLAMRLLVERWFRQLRDVVATGPHGLVRLLCSDWNDCFYGLLKDLPYHHVFNQAESHLNTAMAVVILGRLAAALPGSRVAAAAIAYRGELLPALLAELGDRPFLPRARVGARMIGVDELFFEPQPWILAIDEIPRERRRSLWAEVRRRVWEGEGKGARLRERPGHGENGGVWYALNGPLVLALADLDPDAARETLARLSLARHRQDHPEAWVGAWSGPDCWDPYATSAGDEVVAWEGYGGPLRPGRCRSYLDSFPVCCAHAHAWPLYGWLALNPGGTPPHGMAGSDFDKS